MLFSSISLYLKDDIYFSNSKTVLNIIKYLFFKPKYRINNLKTKNGKTAAKKSI